MSDLIARWRGALLEWLQRYPEIDSRQLIMRRRRLARSGGYADWSAIRTNSARIDEPSGDAPRILMATSIGSHLAAMQLETALAAALRLRGAEVEALLCDEILPGCQMCEPRLFPNHRRFVEHGPQRDLCGFCYSAGRQNYEDLGVRVHAYSETLTDAERQFADDVSSRIPVAEIEHFELDGMKVGEHAKAGALRFFARATIDEEAAGEAVLRRYLKAALLTAASTRRLLAEGQYDVAVFHHGIYVPQGIIGEVARKMGVRVVNWNPAYRKNCFLFSHEDTYHHTLMDEPVSVWEDMPWSEERERQIDDYLRSRWQGDNDWIKFHKDPIFEKEKILSEIGCDPDRPIIGCLTNVMWDAQLHYPANAFANMLEWLTHTIDYFAKRTDVQLAIRVHPAEIRGAVPTRQPVVAEIERLFPVLPPNVHVIGPESRISTYVLAELCDSVIIYGTKTGVELTSFGIPVIVAGEAWIRNKGISIDAPSPESYDHILETLPLGRRLPADVVTRARKYAYHFFFRRMIPLPMFEQATGWPPYRFAGANLQALAPGRSAGLDCVCDGILSGTPFVYD